MFLKYYVEIRNRTIVNMW